jgi:hypothetical protein
MSCHFSDITKLGKKERREKTLIIGYEGET